MELDWGVYGVLSGKRNYTVFVPMPAGRWIMQFSEMGDRAPQPAPSTDNPGTSGAQSQVYVTASDPIAQPRPLRKVDPGRPEDEELAKLRGIGLCSTPLFVRMGSRQSARHSKPQSGPG